MNSTANITFCVGGNLESANLKDFLQSFNGLVSLEIGFSSPKLEQFEKHIRFENEGFLVLYLWEVPVTAVIDPISFCRRHKLPFRYFLESDHQGPEVTYYWAPGLKDICSTSSVDGEPLILHSMVHKLLRMPRKKALTLMRMFNDIVNKALPPFKLL